MPPAPDLGSDAIPKWASDLAVSVAKIEARTDEIPRIVVELKELKATTVPMHEHLKLLKDVEELKDRDVGSRSDWEEMRRQVPVLWSAYEQQQGKRALVLDWRMAIMLLIAIIGTVATLRSAGVYVGIH